MDEMDLGKCDELMRIRDRHLLNTEEYNRRNLYALADEVPGLVAKVRRLNLQVEELQKINTGLRQDVSIKLGENMAVEEDLKESNRLNGEYLKILKALEWVQDEEVGAYWCPSCFVQRCESHLEDCALGHALHGAFPPTSERPIALCPKCGMQAHGGGDCTLTKSEGCAQCGRPPGALHAMDCRVKRVVSSPKKCDCGIACACGECWHCARGCR